MCGIVGYVGERPCRDLLVAGLEKLEYRGYDSAGVAHTRWATHGRVTEENAHPHGDCTDRIHIVLNGIVENHAEMRRELAAEGHEFSSETDAEIVAHLIE